jgi:hypothetical protein
MQAVAQAARYQVLGVFIGWIATHASTKEPS